MNITVKDLLDAGVHFGHQTRRWNPRSGPYIFDHRNGVSIIDLEKTHACLTAAAAFIEDTAAKGKEVLFVATKPQAQEVMRQAAKSTGMPFAVNRWLGGTLTNFATIKRSLDKYRTYLRMEQDGSLANQPEVQISEELLKANEGSDAVEGAAPAKRPSPRKSK